MRALCDVNVNVNRQVAGTPVSPVATTQTTANAAEIEIINYIFSRLVVLHPAWKTAVSGDVKKWASKYRKELMAVIVTNRITCEEDIERGLMAASNQDSDFLPNPGRFAKWCKPLRSHPSHKLFSNQKALPVLPASKESVIAHCAELRAMLS